MACSVLASAVCRALLRHAVARTASAWGVWCVPRPGGAGHFNVLWCNAEGVAGVLDWSGDEVRRVFGSVLSSGLPTVCNDVPPSWRALLAGGELAAAQDQADTWRSWLGVSLADVAGSRALLGLADRDGGYALAQVDDWRQTLDSLAAVSGVDLTQAVPEQVAERTSRAKSEFLSRMSHELRTPLNAMLGFAQLLRADVHQPLSTTQRDRLEHIEQAGSHLMTIITDVLDLSRIEAGGLALSIEPLRLSEVIEDAIEQVQPQARAKGIRPQYTPPAPGSAQADYGVRADRVRLRQALMNLLSNAIKYNLAGGSVKVSVAPESGWMAVSVTDSGPGLSAEQQARLFEPFNRQGAGRGGVEGSGIGLVIVRKLMALMGGSLRLHSEVGRGSSFTLRLPATALPTGAVLDQAADAEPPLLLVAESADGAPAAPRNEGHAFTVLYAEDNEVNVELVRQVMRMRPAYRLLVAHSGAQAVELVRAQRPDVLLLDMHLGDMSGIDVVVTLDRDAATAGIPRLALSADAMPDHIRAARQYGFDIYLTKPLDVSALLNSLDDFAAKAEAAAGR
ncbi:hybrid sensor histidine kinase/response regulator [Aquabacterium sp.]|uniref:ATP-binding response regulator n=1 Tax=Aquabacterium sp. TaxID=1872578 RepID=UPI0035B2587A